jgi:integrase
MYVYVSTGGAISFRYDYRFNGRRETLTLGRYGRAGLTLAQARQRLIEVKKAIADGVSPAVEKQRAKRRLKEAQDFAQVAQGWMDRAPMADSTRDMRRAIFNRDVLPKWKNRLLSEITPDDLRAHCKTIVDRGAPATAIHVRDIVKQIYGWAILHGEKIDNPADDVGPASIATFRPRDRSLNPAEIRIMLMLLGEVATLPTIRLGLKFILLSMVRKSELQDGVWTEVDFDNAVWSIHAGNPPTHTSPVSFALLLNLVGVANASTKAQLWAYFAKYLPEATPENEPLLDRLMDHALNYYEDFVKPTKS